MFDSGSSDLWVHPDLMEPIYNAVKKEAAKNVVEDQRKKFNTSNKCIEMSHEDAMSVFPTMTFTFVNNAVIELGPENYIQYKRGRACIAIFKGFDNESVAFGSTQMINNLVIHDFKANRLGWVNLESCNHFNKHLHKALDTNTAIAIKELGTTITLNNGTMIPRPKKQGKKRTDLVTMHISEFGYRFIFIVVLSGVTVLITVSLLCHCEELAMRRESLTLRKMTV